MMIKKVTTFGGGSKEAKTTNFGGILRFKPLFWQPAPTNPTKLAEKLYLSVLQHPTIFQSKIFTGKYYL